MTSMKKAMNVLTRGLYAAIVIAGVIAAPAAATEDQDPIPIERRSAGAERIGLMIFPPLLWRPPAIGDEVERVTLSNGIVLYLYPDRTLPILDLVGLFRGGRLYDPLGKAGLARVAAAQIRAGGTTSIPPDALNEELESLAVSLELSAGDEAIEVRLNLLSRHTDRGVKLLADVLLRPAFDAGQLELARGRSLEEFRRRRDHPTELLQKEFAALHYTTRHPLGLEPNETSLRNITREDLVAFHERFIRPDNLILAAAGDFDKEALVALLEEALGAWPGSGRPTLPPVPAVQTTARPGVYLIDRPIPQSSIAIGHFGVDRTNPDRQAIELMNYLLGGGGFTSRITRRVRSAEGLAYSVRSRFDTDGPLPGLFQVVALTRTGATSRTVAATLDEIARLRDAPVPASELDAAKEALTNSFQFWFADPTQTVRRLMLLEFEGLPPDYYQTLLGRYQTVTGERLQEVARRYLKPDDLAIIVVGDAKALEPVLSKFGSVQKITHPSPTPRTP
jgi:predicted Zn-dependent peptidase